VNDVNAVIEMRGVSKKFLTETVETHALSNINVRIRRSEWVAIIGPSGSGKSTLLSIIGLLDRSTEGQYLLNGYETARLSVRQRARLRSSEIGFVFQSFNLLADLTVEENVALPLIYRDVGLADRQRRTMAALERVSMSHRQRHFPGQLSGGQQQRVAIARAIAGKPTLLLADEPTGNLDSKHGQGVMDLMAELHREGTTICMVTHDESSAKRASRILNLLDGSIVEEGPHYPEPLSVAP